MLGFIEGRMERQFLNTNMKYMHVVPVQNGTSWPLSQMCNQICTAYEALDMPCLTVVWIDREGRAESADEISEAIRLALIESGADPSLVHILINDRMSENVILADEQVIKAEFGDPLYSYVFEGKSGKSVLKSLYDKVGVSYKETDHGVRMLKKIRLSRSAQRSPTVAKFLQTFQEDCWWI